MNRIGNAPMRHGAATRLYPEPTARLTPAAPPRVPWLPLESPMPPADHAADEMGWQDKPRILVADSGATSSIVARILAQECQIQIVSSPAHIPDTARQPDRRPDLIMLDVMAPAREGFEICRQLKADEMTQRIPVVLITDRDNAQDEADAFKLGAEECITRPFRLDVVAARIRNQIRIKRRNEMLERHANQDSLTEVANRRCFDLTLDAEWRRGIRDRQPLSLLMMDVDCFKQYNDLYGHREGDHCLRQVAKAMGQALTRPGDFLSRYGGEEFAAILPGTDLDGARLIGERLRTAVMALNLPLQRADSSRQVTISVGCASRRPSANLTGYCLLQGADDQLYLAKHSGRNCVR